MILTQLTFDNVMDQWTNRYIGIFLISISTLMLQVTYTRVFSISLWHHFVWMIVSIALFGFGISGTFLMLYTGFSKKNFDNLLVKISFIYSLSTLLIYITSNQVPFDPVTISWDDMQLIYLLIFYILLTIPFFFSGIITALLIENSGSRINTVYFSCFLGSAIGTILVLPFFKYLGGSGVIVLTTFIGSLSGLFFLNNIKVNSKIYIGWMFLLIILLPFSQNIIPVRISPYKSLNIAMRYQDAKLFETKWNSYSRIDVVDSGYIRYAPGLSLTYKKQIPKQIGVIVDGSEVNAITEYNNSRYTLDFIRYLPQFLVYNLVLEPKSLVIDSGGGFGVLSALTGNSSKIIAVEENAGIVDLLKGKYSSFSGEIYKNPNVKVVVSDGRSYIQRTKEKFDVIELSTTSGGSPSSTGLYAVSENYLYTEESFISFLTHLSPGGVLSVQRWLLPPPREDIRIVSLALASLNSIGIHEPEKHIVVYRSWGTFNVLISKTPFNQNHLSIVRDFCSRLGFDVVYLSDIDPNEVNKHNKFPEPIYYNIIIELLKNNEDYYDSYLFNIRPTNDEKPFFFSFFKWNRLTETYNMLDNRWQPLVEGGLLIPIVMIQALILSIIFILLPVIRVKNNVLKNNFRELTYFLLIGLGYMFIEITMIQKFILILGNTIYSISTVLFSLLLSSGLGSYHSNDITPGKDKHLKILGLIGGISILFGIFSRRIDLILGLSLPLRAIVSFFIIVPLGFLMGMPFPLGIRQLSKSKREIINWAWAINGCASVIGSILPTMIALFSGFSNVYLLAGFCYLLTILMIKREDFTLMS